MFRRQFALPIAPRGKERPRARVKRGVKVEQDATGARALTTIYYPEIYTPNATLAFERDVAALAARYRPRTPVDFPVEVDVLFVLSRPVKYHGRSYPDGLMLPESSRFDTDNMLKAVIDALSPSQKKILGHPVRPGFWTNDNLVIDLRGRVRWAERDGLPRIEVDICEASAELVEIDREIDRAFELADRAREAAGRVMVAEDEEPELRAIGERGRR